MSWNQFHRTPGLTHNVSCNLLIKYHSTKRNLPGNLEGVLPNSYYYANIHNKYAMHVYEPMMGAFFNREFPTSWRQIDMGVVVNDDNANKDEPELDKEDE